MPGKLLGPLAGICVPRPALNCSSGKGCGHGTNGNQGASWTTVTCHRWTDTKFGQSSPCLKVNKEKAERVCVEIQNKDGKTI